MLFWEKAQDRLSQEADRDAGVYSKGYVDAMVAAGVWVRRAAPVGRGVSRDDRSGFAVSGSLADIAAAVGARFPGSVRTH